MSLLALEEAQEKLLALAPVMGSEQVPVEEAAGRVLAGDVVARRTQPASDLSAMDGYAIAGEGPWRLVGESRAGKPFSAPLEAGHAVRISTGAHMPEGAERVLVQENTRMTGKRLEARHLPEAGKHVRRAGFDFSEGDCLVEAGTHLGPAHVALALAAGHGHLKVARRPKVAILEAGDELARDPEVCGPHQLPASNGAMIAAMFEPLTGASDRIGPVADDPGSLNDALQEAERADILVTCGGASVGPHDLVQQALTDWGAKIAFWKVAIKPGKPLLVAARNLSGKEQVVLGLPGNPVSSFVTAFLFAVPLIRAAQGMQKPLCSPLKLDTSDPLPATGSRREFLRGTREGLTVRISGSQDSSALRSLASANCLIDRPANAREVRSGEPVDVLLFDHR